jgi:uncharacterized protein (DUF1330 family)
MAAYFIADLDITDPDGYRNYARQVPPTLEKYGGKTIVADGKPETIEGDWHTKRIVIVEFPSVEQARAWQNSPEYSAIAGLRHASANARIILVQGL